MTQDTGTHLRPILALVTDLFFTLKIGDTAKAVGLPIHFASNAAEFLDRFRQVRPALVMADLSIEGVDMAALFEELAAETDQAPVPILGYTTHADWKRTGPLHDRCTRVVTKETLSRDLGGLIQQLIQHG
jgi:CheY-like chemotaxis protein